MNWFLPRTDSEARRSAEVDRTARTRLNVESLEHRDTPAAIFNPVFGTEPTLGDGHGEWSNPNILLIFWGDYWQGAAGSDATTIQQDSQKVLDSGVLGVLTQYGSDGHAHLGVNWLGQHVQSIFLPGNLTALNGFFDDGSIHHIIDVAYQNQFGTALFKPSNTLNVVVTPPGIRSGAKDNPGGWNGGSDLWVGVARGGHVNLPSEHITPGQEGAFEKTFAHEVVEAMSDPTDGLGNHGVTVGPGTLWFSGGDDQIGDHEGNSYNYRAPNGTLVQPFWSDNAIQGEIRTIQKWVATDGNKQAVTLDPIWSNPSGISVGATFSGQFDLTIDGDQFGPANDQPGNDDIVLDTTTNGGLLVWLNGEKFQFDRNQIRNVTVNPGLGHNSVTILSMATNDPKKQAITYTVNTTSWDGVVTTVDVMPQAKDLDGLVAPLTVHGGVNPYHPAQTILNLHDELYPGGIDYELKDGAAANSGVLTRATNDANHFLRGTPIRFDNLTTLNVYSAVLFQDAFTIDDTPCTTHLEGSIKGCVVDVQGTTLPLSYKGFSNNDRVHVGHGMYSPNPAFDNYKLDTIHADVSVSGDFGNYALDLTADDGGDTTSQNVLLTDQGVYFGGAVRIGGTQLRNFNVILGTAAGTKVDVVATPNTGPVGSTTTHVDSYAPTFGVNVDGGIGSAQFVRGLLSIGQGLFGNGRADLLIDDSIDTVGRNVIISSGQVAGLSPAAIRYDATHLNSFTVRGGSGINHFTVYDSPNNGHGMQTKLFAGSGADVVNVNGTSGPLLVNGGGGWADVVNVGQGDLTTIRGAVTLTNPTGATFVTIDDHLDWQGRSPVLDASSLTFPGISAAVHPPPARISWSNANLESLQFFGGSGGNTITVSDYPNAVNGVRLHSGTGDDKVTVAGGTGAFYLDGDAGADQVTVGNGSLTGINGTVYLANSKGHSFVTADDSKAILDRNYRLFALPLNVSYPGSLTLTGTNTTVRFNSGEIQTFAVKSGSGWDEMGALSLDNRVQLAFDGGGGKNTVLGPGKTNTWDITGTNQGNIDGLFAFQNAGSLIGETGVDTFKFEPNSSLSGTINGGGGGDWLDYSAAAQGVFVDLSIGKASLVNGGKAGGVSQIRNVRGSNVGNVLRGDGQGNIFVGGAGADLLVGGSGRNVLIGGGGTDQIQAGAAGDLLIAGTTSYDADTAALAAIQVEWLSADTYAQRIAKLKTGVGPGNAVKLQFGVTVFADPAANTLTGGAGQDWFFASPLDTILNKQAGEAVN